jgi:DNA-directed RNA polymerase subunit H (RpoH/RPB5)
MNFSKEVRRSFATLGGMLRARGLDVSSLERVAAEDVLALASARSVFHVDLPSCECRVLWNLNARLRLADMRKLLDASVRTHVVVARERPNASTLKGIDELHPDVQFFDMRELQFDIAAHELVPLHEPVRSEDEIDALVQRLRLKSRYQLPLILSTDPMARYLGLKPGQVVRITRASPSAGSYVLYRCCTRAA